MVGKDAFTLTILCKERINQCHFTFYTYWFDHTSGLKRYRLRLTMKGSDRGLRAPTTGERGFRGCLQASEQQYLTTVTSAF
jgi:hypothetical protein